MEVVSVRYLSLKHHGAAAGELCSSGQSKAERDDWALVLRVECAARGQAVADLSRDNSSFAKVSLGRIIRVIPTLASGIVALVCRRGGIGVRFLATLVVTAKLRASQAQAASSLAISALVIQRLRPFVRYLRPGFAMNESRTKRARLQRALLLLDRMQSLLTGLGSPVLQQRPPALLWAR